MRLVMAQEQPTPISESTTSAAAGPEQVKAGAPALPPLPLLAAFSWRLISGTVLLLLLIFVLGLGTGVVLAAPAHNPSNVGWWEMLTGQTAAVPLCEHGEQSFYPEFQTFWEAMGLLYRDYYGELPTPQDATYHAIRGVLSALTDPNTSFLTPTEAEHFRTNLAGSFEGIGARVEWDEELDTLRITEPFENQPAWRAGIKRGDYILAVDGESLVGTDVTFAVARIRGPKGSTVVLSVLHEIGAEPEEITVERDRIETPTIVTETLGSDQNIAYIKLNTFNQNAGQLVRQAVEAAMDREVAGLVFDLRGNSGGLLREAVKVAGTFMQDAPVLIERFSNGTTENYETDGTAAAPDLPMIVLVNEGSASASEIVAGALQDQHRAQLLGVTTYGKGSVQLPHTLKDGSIMRVTVARWYTPNDRTIDGTGLTPDIQVERTEADLEKGVDPQLERAVEQLEAEIER